MQAQSDGAFAQEIAQVTVKLRGTDMHVDSDQQPKTARPEKIPHLKKLGVTAVELLPVHEFNLKEPAGIDPAMSKAIRARRRSP